MTVVADTNLWLRFVDVASPDHEIAADALRQISSGHLLYLVPQNLSEFRVVATRPREVNGLGWDSEKTAALLGDLRSRFSLLIDDEQSVNQWFELVRRFRVLGKKAHDARLAAIVLARNIDVLVTFNFTDFSGWPVRAIHPSAVPEALHSTTT